MRISKTALAVMSKFKSDADPRYALQHVQVEPSGRLVATNGHWLAMFDPAKGETDETDAPMIQGLADAAPMEKAVLVPQEVIREACKAVPKTSTIPILAGAFLRPNCKTAQIATTDLERPKIQTFNLGEERFPSYENVNLKSEPTATVTLSAAYLKIICEAAMAMNPRSPTVKLGLYERGDRKHDAPVTLDAVAEQGTLRVVLMPISK